MDISKLDKNFAQKQVENSGYTYYDALSKPFVLEGFYWYEHNGKQLYRLPADKKDLYNRQQRELADQTTGGAIRFKTNSKNISIKGTYKGIANFPHMTLIGTGGFDIYAKENGKFRFAGTLFPNSAADNYIDKQWGEMSHDGKMREFIVYMPIHAIIETLSFGFDTGSELLPPDPHKIEKPIVFYGSSITHGGCASRPGNTYPAILGRIFDAPIINLGFAGNALGEEYMAEIVSEPGACVFVYDYDFNAPDPEHLEKTHKPFFDIYRKNNPDTPVIIISAPSAKTIMEEDFKARRNIVRKTYDTVVAEGEKNAYFIDGSTFFDEPGREDCTVDLVHPTDLGFYFMAKTIAPVIKKSLEK